ncbi:long-chain fatty acid--CoA ligase (plasmid) [Rhodococcus ruber]|uniref:long-chain-fatty-acid--CoA ligase n=1 Tax=Rhodococcus ruber TaxID=1830 RepID=UPI002659B982|nr:long-chain fatty acid--CoA ligase [Rhodococcus ruber]WKK14831.1 long-chain fatty acid--CoA ligase [Rhodococcus ruber]
MNHLAQNLIDTAAKHPDRTALKLDDLQLTYQDLLASATTIAETLHGLGLQAGDRVALVLPNVPSYAVAFYGAQIADLIVVPINPLCKAREISYFLQDSGAQLVFAHCGETADQVRAAAGDVIIWECEDGAPARLEATERVRNTESEFFPAGTRILDDTAVLLYTSGTTGKPKGAELTYRNLTTNARTTAEYITVINENDVILGCLPLFHSFGLSCVLNAAIYRGACVTLIPRFEARRALEIMKRDQATVFAGVPTMYSALVNCTDADRDVPTLRSCISGGASLPVEVLHSFEAAFDCMILEGYGLSETSPAASFNLPTAERRPGTVGRALPGVALRVIDAEGVELADGEIGEIVIRGENVMRGYWRRPKATADAMTDDWFRTGDLGFRDRDGYFTIVDRKKDMIIRGGYNVYPREVEEVLYEHPDVVEAAVVGIPHPDLGQEVAAAVSLRPGSTATPEDLQATVRDALAAYKYPRSVWILDSLPKGPTGKILRREILPQS